MSMFDLSVAHDVNSAAAADRLLDALDSQADYQLLLLLIGGRHQPEPFLARAAAVFPGVPVFGGSVAGIIHREITGYTGYEAGILAVRPEAGRARVISERGLNESELETGRRIGQRLKAEAAEGAVAMLFYDSVAQRDPLTLHPASPLLDGIYRALGGHPLHIVGAGLMVDAHMSSSYVVLDGKVEIHAAFVIAFDPAIDAHTEIVHGCRPISGYFTVTRVEGAEILELDGKPALEVLQGLIGGAGTDPNVNISLLATLGQRHGDPHAPYDERDYVNRLILRADPERGSLIIFEPDFAAGARVQLMARDNRLMLSSVRDGVERLNAIRAPVEEDLAFYFDCAGRARVVTGASEEEADVLVESLPPHLRVMGFYSGVEIAPVGEKSRSQDWTGVLTLLHRRNG